MPLERPELGQRGLVSFCSCWRGVMPRCTVRSCIPETAFSCVTPFEVFQIISVG
jgi:hypothetical protein